MKYKKTTLPNGLRVITTPRPNMESATLTVWVNVGSRSETAKVGGISHFLEHMVFKGSSKRPSAKEIAETIDSFGGEFNASTSKEWTNFYINGRKGKIETVFDVLSDMVLAPVLDAKEIEKEKGVIVEEIGMYEDTPMMHIGDIFERLIFRGAVMGRDVIGTSETVKGIERNDFVRYRDMHYSSENVLITVAGGVSVEESERLVQKYFSSLKKKEVVDPDPTKVVQKKPQVLLETKKNEQAHLIMGFRGRKRGHKDYPTESVMTTILGQGMSSRMFTQVREKRGLAYSVRSGVESYMDTGYVETYAGVDPKRVDEAVKVIRDESYGLAHEVQPITQEELTKAKEYIKGHIALALESTKAVNRFLGIRELKLGKIETPDEVYRKIDAVSIKDVVKYAKEIFRPENMNLALIGPFEDQKRFEKLVASSK